MKKKGNLPPIGMRIIKSAAAIAICYLVSFLRRDSGIVFYSQLAALWCMQSYMSETRKNAAQRFIGTVIGALYGLVYILLFPGCTKAVSTVMISLMIIVVLYTTVLIKKKQASYFSCVVFLSIVVNHMADANPYLFVWNRFLDTVIGIAIGVGVNSFSLPKEKQTDILFLSGLDDTLLHEKDNMSDFSRVELNRMLDQGLQFTISTMRTPASLMEPMQAIRLHLPVIAMDGAVLYDMENRRYIRTYVISNAMSRKILELVHQKGLECFANVVIDDSLVIFYQESGDEIHRKLVEEMRRSPYRNYVKSEHLADENVIYFMLLYPRQVMEEFFAYLQACGITEELKVLFYDSKDYPGYAYIKIYNKNASKENMLEYLKQQLGLEKTVTFGSIEGRYDVVVSPGDTNSVVQEIRRRFEPLKIPWKNRKREGR